MKVRDIKSAHLVQYVAERSDERATPSTIRNELAALKRAFTLALSSEPVQSKLVFPVVRVSNARQGVVSSAEIEAIAAELPAELRGLALAAFYSGWRMRAEPFPLRWPTLADNVNGVAPGRTKAGEGRRRQAKVDHTRSPHCRRSWP